MWTHLGCELFSRALPKGLDLSTARTQPVRLVLEEEGFLAGFQVCRRQLGRLSEHRFPPVQSCSRSLSIHIHRLLISLGCSIVAALFSESTKTVDCCLGSHGSGCRKLVSSTGNLFVCGLAFPDADSNPPDAILHINEHANLEEMLRFRDVWRLKPD